MLCTVWQVLCSSRTQDNITMDLQKVGWGDMDCIDLAHDTDSWQALVNVVMNLRTPEMQGIP